MTRKERVALVSLIASLSLTVAKLTIGLMIGSLALVTDALHSGTDAIATLVTFLAVRFADRPAFRSAGQTLSYADVDRLSRDFAAYLQNKLGVAYLFVAHNLSVVRHISSRVAVMYLGRIVESGDTEDVFEHPLHPYTQTLISAVPVPDPKAERTRQRIVLEGDVPSPIHPPSGCHFHPRCPRAQAQCRIEPPLLRELAPQHMAACHFPNPN